MGAGPAIWAKETQVNSRNMVQETGGPFCGSGDTVLRPSAATDLRGYSGPALYLSQPLSPHVQNKAEPPDPRRALLGLEITLCSQFPLQDNEQAGQECFQGPFQLKASLAFRSLPSLGWPQPITPPRQKTGTRGKTCGGSQKPPDQHQGLSHSGHPGSGTEQDVTGPKLTLSGPYTSPFAMHHRS